MEKRKHKLCKKNSPAIFIVFASVLLSVPIQPAWSEAPPGLFFGIGPRNPHRAGQTLDAYHAISVGESGCPCNSRQQKISHFQQQCRGCLRFCYINPYNYLLDHKSIGYNRSHGKKTASCLVCWWSKKTDLYAVSSIECPDGAFPTAAAIASTCCTGHAQG